MSSLVRLLEEDPDLGDDLTPHQLRFGRRELLARAVEVPAGSPLSDVLADVESGGLLGLLVLGGLAVRRVELVGRAGVELIGAGDIVRPWEGTSELGSIPARVSWRAAAPTRIAILDDDVQHTVSRFPPVLRRLVARAAGRADGLALNLAVGQLPRVDARLHVLFWHLADRFGHMRGGRAVVPLPLSHARLAELVYARRPTVTKALHELARRDVLVREAPDRWVLCGPPPSTGADLVAPPVAAAVEDAGRTARFSRAGAP